MEVCRLRRIAVACCVTWLFPVVAAAGPFLLVADGGADLIRRYNLGGVQTAEIRNDLFSFPTLLTVGPSGDWFITDINFVSPDGPLLVRCDLSGNILSQTTSAAIFGRQGGGIVDVTDSGRGTLIVTSTLNTHIAEVSYDLQVIRLIPSGAVTGGLRTLFATMSPAGERFYVTDGDGQSGQGFVRVYDYLTGEQVGEIRHAALQFPLDIHFAPSGELYITDRGADFVQDRILVFDASLNFIREFSSGAPLHYNFGDFDIIPGGRLALIETNFPTETPIRILTRSGRLTREFGSEINSATAIAVGNSVPEPATLFLMATGVVGTALRRRLFVQRPPRNRSEP